ncbi:MAG: hypothetical protein CHACPFDD_00699 [Phycisphaerae bacterium]|nr:hypothetical protein [Phycisphaerae bacterium]
MLSAVAPTLAFTLEVSQAVYDILMFLKVLIGFSIIIFVHESGHFLAAKWVGVRVDRFAVGFGYRLFGWRRGEGFTFGPRPDYTAEQLQAKRYGETDYCFKALPIGGYVKMLGHDDIQIDERTGAVTMTDDPRAFTNRPVGQRMVVISAGVLMNLIFGALAYMAVFLIGVEMQSPVVMVQPDGPAARAGLKTGDRILTINDSTVDTFKDVFVTEVLSDGPLAIAVERDGKPLPEPVTVVPTTSRDTKLPSMGVTPMLTTELAAELPGADGSATLVAHDRIIAVDGVPTPTALDVRRQFLLARNGSVELTAERPVKGGGPPQRVVSRQPVVLTTEFAEVSGIRAERLVDEQHILGLLPRRMVNRMTPGSPAEEAGFKPKDVVVEWDTIANPTWADIIETIQAKAGAPIRVVVERAGEKQTLHVTPRRAFRLFGTAPARVGIEFVPERDRVVASAIAPGSPFAALGMPRGSLILSVDERSTPTWFSLVEVLRAAAGREVEVEYQSGPDRVTAHLHVPASISSEFGLSPISEIVSIAGEKEVTLSIADGKGGARDVTMSLPAPVAVRTLLKKHIGKTVDVEYVVAPEAPIQRRAFAVTAENWDPWQMRVLFTPEAMPFRLMTQVVHAHGNPIRAMWMGVRSTMGTITEVYRILKQMASRNIGVEHVQGPVGIFRQAITIAKEGFVDLLYFLAFFSVNLAVLNFLPLPVVDGGLMVFLLIEKIKGKPLSLTTQVVSTMVGLAFILICFLFVTIQDIGKLFAG